MGTRDAAVETTPIEDANVPAGRRIVAVIGIDRYRFHQRLRNAASDARGILRLLTRSLDFEQPVPPLFDADATRDAIMVMIDEQLRAELRPEDELVLFFSGHGLTREDRIGDRERTTGFLVPVEARPGHWNDYIKVHDWLDSIDTLPARHVLVIIDACHSGVALADAITVFRGGRTRYHEDLKRRVSRKAIASAMHDQLARDGGPIEGHSLFTGVLIDGFETGNVDLDDNRILTGTELALYVQQEVAQASDAEQTPDFGTFGADARGELCIPLPESITPARGVPVVAKEPEATEATEDEVPRRWGVPVAVAGLSIALGYAAWSFGSKTDDDPDLPDPPITKSDVGQATVKPEPSVAPMPSCPPDMVMVPAGEFTAGLASPEELEAAVPECEALGDHCNRDLLERSLDSKGARPIEAFCMDRTEVTVAEFAPWLDDQRATLKEDGRFLVDPSDLPWVGLWASREVDGSAYDRITMLERDPQGRWRPPASMERRPAFLVSWTAADAWCRSKGQRLPSELEWEYAARGAGRSEYPWADREIGCADVAFDRISGECVGLGGLADVGGSGEDVSWSDVQGLGGNVSEWVVDLYEDPARCPTPPGGEARTCHVYKGGNWGRPRVLGRSYLRFLESHRNGGIYSTIGFRCVTEPQ